MDFKEKKDYGFKITEKRKLVWEKELEILEQIIDICNENNIDYFVGAGTMLGAVRHNGFIPWDDDIDVFVTRKNYIKLCEIAKLKLKNPFFVQNFSTEEGYYYGHTQIRNSNTTAIIKGDDCRNFNHGIFVDIFPIDNVPNNIEERKKFLKRIERKKLLFNLYYFEYPNNIIKKLIKRGLVKLYWKIHDYKEEIKKFEDYVQKYDDIETEECGIISVFQNRFFMRNEWIQETQEVKFENLKVKIPVNYDKCLKCAYGDNYMEIPKNKNGSVHGLTFFDTHNSYLIYKDKINEIVDKIKNNEVDL